MLVTRRLGEPKTGPVAWRHDPVMPFARNLEATGTDTNRQVRRSLTKPGVCAMLHGGTLGQNVYVAYGMWSERI
ncbi:MAG: hypothetical protein JWO42_1394 [Chloroflexi bacterium]|nr:hypothetical protein [Chloroflexota bacterium]